MNNEPLVTVGIPVYNGANYIRECLEGVRRQTYSNLEILVADNGSRDETAAIVAELAAEDDRIRLLPSPENQGQAWNFNRLVAAAHGDLFKWAAHDDLIAPDFVRVCVAALREDPSAVLAYPLGIDIDETGQPVAEYRFDDIACEEDAGQRAASTLIGATKCWEFWGVVRLAELRRTRLLMSHGFDDRILVFELALQGRFIRVPEVLFLHREHSARIMATRTSDADMYRLQNPSYKGKHAFPRWRMIREYRRALSNSDLTPRQRKHANQALAKWSWRWRGNLVREVGRPVYGPIRARWRS